MMAMRQHGRTGLVAIVRCGGALVVTVVLTALVAHAEEQAPPGWEITFGTQIGAPAGFVKVGENDRPGDTLHFHNDLGIDLFEDVQFGAVYHLTPRDTLRARFDYTFLYGSTNLSGDVDFNGATLAGGTHLNTQPVFWRLTGFYDHEFIAQPNGLRLAAGVGLTFVYLDFKLNGTLAPDTVGHETKEDFYAQELPVPLLLLHAEYPLSDRIEAAAWVDGGFLPPVDSLRTEGGTVTLSQNNVDVFLGLRFFLTPRLTMDTGYAYTYFTQHETSHEDDNNIIFIGNAFGLNLAYRF